MTIEPLQKQFVPDEVITAFLKGDRFALGPFRTDGEYLYLNNAAIAYRASFGEWFRIDQPTATPPPRQTLFNRIIAFFTWRVISFWFGATIGYLIFDNIFKGVIT